MTESQEQAFDLLDIIIRRRAEYDAASRTIADAIASVSSEYTHGLWFMDGEVLSALCHHIDWLLGASGAGLSSWFLHECSEGHPGLVEADGKDFKIGNLEDLRAYVLHDGGKGDADV